MNIGAASLFIYNLVGYILYQLPSLTLASRICLIWAEKAFKIRHLIFYDEKV